MRSNSYRFLLIHASIIFSLSHEELPITSDDASNTNDLHAHNTLALSHTTTRHDVSLVQGICGGARTSCEYVRRVGLLANWQTRGSCSDTMVRTALIYCIHYMIAHDYNIEYDFNSVINFEAKFVYIKLNCDRSSDDETCDVCV